MPKPKRASKFPSLDQAFIQFPLADGPEAGVINGLVEAAHRISRGEVEDGIALARSLVKPKEEGALDWRAHYVLSVVERALEHDARSELDRMLETAEPFAVSGWDRDKLHAIWRIILRSAPERALQSLAAAASHVDDFISQTMREQTSEAAKARMNASTEEIKALVAQLEQRRPEALAGLVEHVRKIGRE